jgi:hypothetical protein
MKKELFLAALVIGGGFLTSCGNEAEKDLRPDYVKENMSLVWADEFDGAESEPNPEFWDYNTGGGGWGNGERQYYTNVRTNSFVSDGTLKIVAHKNEKNKWTSARLITSFKKSFTYG